METNVDDRRVSLADLPERLLNSGGPMSDAEIALMRDTQGFIEHAIRNGFTLALVLSVLQHDIDGIVRHGLSLDEARSDGFLPKVTGYSQVGADSVGQPDEPLD